MVPQDAHVPAPPRAATHSIAVVQQLGRAFHLGSLGGLQQHFPIGEAVLLLELQHNTSSRQWALLGLQIPLT